MKHNIWYAVQGNNEVSRLWSNGKAQEDEDSIEVKNCVAVLSGFRGNLPQRNRVVSRPRNGYQMRMGNLQCANLRSVRSCVA